MIAALVLSVIGVFCIAGTHGAANLPAVEMNALEAFFHATGGPNWAWKAIGNHWVFTPNASPCTENWQGITCILPAPHSVYYVSAINLPEYNLVGPLPDSIGDFDYLSTLELSYNYLNETIPAAVGNLTSLQYLTLQFNQFTSSLPETLCGLTELKELNMEGAHLHGTIPHCIGQLGSLTTLAMYSNNLRGSIPTSLGNLSQLQILQLQFNELSGSIPDSVGAMSSLQEMYLNNNDLTGPIPCTISNMSSLTSLYVDQNRLNGSLPASLAQLPRLMYIFAYSNALTGTIPNNYGSFANLSKLVLDENALTGTLPSALGSVATLNTLSVAFNRLSGTVPDSITALTRLQYIYLQNNCFTGTLPAALGALTGLWELACESNAFSGSIPSSIGALTEVTFLYMYENQLTGSVPSSLGSMTKLTTVALYNNTLTGSLPESIGNLVEVTDFYVYENFLSGTLPASVGNMSALLYLFLQDNLLRGCLPAQIGRLRHLQELEANDNVLSGALPPALADLRSLTFVLLNDNKLSGCLDGVFNPSAQRHLTSIQLNNNQFTGTLPGSLFALPALESLIMYDNCFHGFLPEGVCNATTVNSLVLDGLSSATSCRRTLPSGAYLLSRSVGGTLPRCLFELPNLGTLHLSGNSFHGKLPAVLALGGNLTDLSVSHNQLSGDIPAAFQERSWYNFDASYNRLAGTLQTGAFPSPSRVASLSVENNRLSGRIPGTAQDRENINMLGTNLFECNLAGSNLPAQDSGRDNYQCGSSGFNVPFFVWLSLTFLALLGTLWCWRQPPGRENFLAAATSHVKAWYASSQRVVGGRPVLAGLMHVLGALCWTSVYCAVYVTVVLLPCYLLLSHYNGTMTHKYAWAVSAAFLSGVVPVAAELLLWVFLLGVACALAARLLSGRAAIPQPSGEKEINPSVVKRHWEVYLIFAAINLVVVVGVNVLYVYIAIYQSSALLVLAQVLMSFFKLLWSGTCTDAILRSLVEKFAPQLLRTDGNSTRYRSEFLTLLLFVSVFNNIAIPCLVVAAVSPNCFYDVFQRAPAVHSQYRYRECAVSGSSGQCFSYAYVYGQADFDAPFTYNYQCSSSLITYYAPAFVNLCIVAAFVSPVMTAIAVQITRVCSPGSSIHSAVDRLLPRVVKPIVPAEEEQTPRTYFNANQLLVNVVTYVGVLLTFGVMLPPLGVALAVTVTAVVFVAKLKIGRFLCAAEEHGQLDKFVRILEQQCEGVGSASFLQSALWMLLTLSCLFYTLFLFDTLGDAVGFRGALWVLIVVPLIPVVAFAGYNMSLQRTNAELGNGGAQTSAAGDVELGSKAAQHAAQEGETYNVMRGDGI